MDADRTRLKQVIINLLGNAIKYNREGGDVFIELHRYAKRLVYLVRDVGPGLHKQQLEQLFVPLQRLHIDKQYNEGAGLGLAISHALVKQMQGDIKVTSMPGVGTVFQLQFPHSTICPDKHIVSKIIDIKAADDSDGEKYTLLYVDDNAGNVGFMRQLILCRPDLHFIATTDPQQCADLARAYSPDIIVLDLHMQESCIDELVDQLRSSPATMAIPVMAVNEKKHPAAQARFEDKGFKACCAEPLDANEFHQNLDRVLCGTSASKD